MSQPSRTAFTPAPRPKGDAPSKFVIECLGLMRPDQQDRVAVDIGAGYGRHARALAGLGFWVLALDLDEAALASTADRGAPLGVVPVVADLKTGLPCRPASVDLAVCVQFPIEDKLLAIGAALKAEGSLIYETPGGHGQNWRELPKTGQLSRAMQDEYKLLIYRERSVGPAAADAVVVQLLAQKRLLVR